MVVHPEFTLLTALYVPKGVETDSQEVHLLTAEAAFEPGEGTRISPVLTWVI